MITPTPVSSRARVNASDSSTTVSGRNALRTSGRSMVILAIPSPESSYLMSEYSPAGVHCTFTAFAPSRLVPEGGQGYPVPVIVEAWLPRAAASNPHGLAIETPERGLTYAELHLTAQAAAGALAKRGVVPGDHVGLALPAGLPFTVALHA